MQVAAGVVGAPPMPVPVDYQLTVNARGRLLDEKEFGDIILKTGADGEITRLRDVARLQLAAGDYALRSLLDNKQAVGIGVFQAPGSNALQLSSTVRRTMEELKKNFPEGVEYRIVYDPTINVRDGIREVVKTLFEAILLVVLVVVLFLQTWRASIIPLVAVPISIVGTFAVLLGFGFSINTLSLFGLVLAIGIVVDDAIVVVENVERNIEAGLSPRRRVVQGHGGSERPDHRDLPGPVRRVRARGVPERPHRRVLPPVRPDDRVLDRDLGRELAHAEPRLERDPAQVP